MAKDVFFPGLRFRTRLLLAVCIIVLFTGYLLARVT